MSCLLSHSLSLSLFPSSCVVISSLAGADSGPCVLQQLEDGSLFLRKLDDNIFEVEIVPSLFADDKMESIQNLFKAAIDSGVCASSKTNEAGLHTSVTVDKREDKARKLFAYIRATSSMGQALMPKLSDGQAFINEDSFTGWMWKLGGVAPFKVFQKRYFVFSRVSNTLQWHVSEEAGPQNVISLSDIQSVEKSEGGGEDEKEYGIRMRTVKKTYILVAPTEEAMLRWIQMLKPRNS